MDIYMYPRPQRQQALLLMDQRIYFITENRMRRYFMSEEIQKIKINSACLEDEDQAPDKARENSAESKESAQDSKERASSG